MQQLPSVNCTDKFVLNILKSIREIRHMKLHEENKPGSMQNFENHHDFDHMIQVVNSCSSHPEVCAHQFVSSF